MWEKWVINSLLIGRNYKINIKTLIQPIDFKFIMLKFSLKNSLKT